MSVFSEENDLVVRMAAKMRQEAARLDPMTRQETGAVMRLSLFNSRMS